MKYPDLPHRLVAVILAIFSILTAYGSGRLQDGHHPQHKSSQAIAEAGSETLLIVASPAKPLSCSLNDIHDFPFAVAPQVQPIARERHAVEITLVVPRLSARLKSTQMTSTSL